MKFDMKIGDFKPDIFWALSNQILELAGKGYPRAQFLRDITMLIMSTSQCDKIELIVRDGGRIFFCRALREKTRNVRFEEITNLSKNGKTLTWSAKKTGFLEKLCQEIINKQYDPSLPYFTEDGSFWLSEMDNQLIPDSEITDPHEELGIGINKDCKSVAIIPIDVNQDRLGLLEMASNVPDFFSGQQVALFEQMARTIGSALTHRRSQVALRERVKELTCLYGIAKLVQQPGISIDYILQETVKLMPPAWLYPEISSAQIVLDDQVFITSGIGKAVHQMKADIIIDQKVRGFVELRYAEERPRLDDGVFLLEERNLIDTIAQELSIIIEQMEAETEKDKLQEQLRHSDRLATLGQLVAGVAHELNEPLANILGFAQLAIKDPDLTGQVQQDISKIIDASLHAREVIKRLLMSARDAPSTKNKINLNDLIEDGLYFFKSRCAKSGIQLITDLSEKLPGIFADRSQLMQVLTNLVVNAVQAMPQGGRLTIKTSADVSSVILIMEDTGGGITDEVRQRIFDPFFTTKDDDQGTGLGLPIVHGIITSHGGGIEVESEVGTGTKFIIRLPAEMTGEVRGPNNG